MKPLHKKFLMYALVAVSLCSLPGCDDDDAPQPKLTGESESYTLSPVSNSGVTGTVTFAERDDDQVLITLQLTGLQAGSTHPAHIHANSAVEGGAIVLSLEAVDGSTGKSETVVNALDDGTAISYETLIGFDGHVNVHMSPDDLTVIAHADIGENALTGDKKVYTLGPVTNPEINGTATFEKRANGETLVTVALVNTTDGESYASHIHGNSAVESGGILIDLTNVDGTTGMAISNVSQMNDGTPITFEELLAFDGYVNVHSGAGLIAQGDIGGNELTGDEKVYTLTPVADPNVSGTATFAKRKNGNTLVTVALENTEAGASFPSHIHANTIAEAGSIVIGLNNVDGTTGIARTTVRQLNDGTPITYEELLDFNGYLNVHTGGTFVVQGDIGQNELTGDTEVYPLGELGGSGVSGNATFAKRKNGKALITLALTGTADGGDHPAHIHANDAATGGGIVLDLNNVNGASGKSATSVSALNDGTAITYDQLIAFDGHINVHESPTNLANKIAQGNIGSNAP